MMHRIFMLLILPVLIWNCATPSYRPSRYQDDEVPTIETSLFKSDRESLSEEEIAQILQSKIEVPRNAKIALMKFQSKQEIGRASSNYGRFYWRSEDYLNLQQSYMDTLSSKLFMAERVDAVTALPSLLTPQSPTISILREAAVRLQADLLLVFRVSSDVYQKYKLFGKDEAKAFSTCEAVLMDIRTGIIPLTSVVTREHFTYKEKFDINIDETMKRAEKAAVIKSLNAITDQIVEFLDSVP